MKRKYLAFFLVAVISLLPVVTSAKTLTTSELNDLFDDDSFLSTRVKRKKFQAYNSRCEPAFIAKIIGRYKIDNGKFSSYKLSNGQVWEEFKIKNGKVQINESVKIGSYRSLNSRQDKKHVKIYQQNGFCTMKFLESEKEIKVLKINN